MKLTNTIKTVLVAMAVTIGLSSCSKKSDNQPVYLSALSIINASPTTQNLDFYVDNTKGTPTAFAFGEKTDYLNAYPGQRQLTVTKEGELTALKSESFILKQQVFYSLFIVNKLESVEILTLEDDLTKPDVGKAKIRFVNLSPDGGSMDLAIAGKEDKLVVDKAFRGYSPFQNIDAADKVTFNVINSVTGNIEASLVDLQVEVGKFYTVWVKGLKDSTTDETKFGVSVFKHK